MAKSVARWTILLAAGAAAITGAVPVAAQSSEIRGAVTYQGGAAIPKGVLEISLEDRASPRGSRAGDAKVQTTSDGGSKTIAFALSPPAGSTTSPSLDIIARLESVDGWLVARGSARFEPGAPVAITLHTVMY